MLKQRALRPAKTSAVAGDVAPTSPASLAAPAARAGLDDSCLSHVLGYHLSLADVCSRQFFGRHIGEPFGLRPVDFTILVLVAFNPGVTQKQLAQALSISAPNITMLIDRLAEKGWLARLRSETDRRAQNIHLTDAGRALAERSYEASKTMEASLVEGLSQGERALLVELLHKIGARRAG